MSVVARPAAETDAQCSLCDKSPSVRCPDCPKLLPGMRRKPGPSQASATAATEWDAILNRIMLQEIRERRGVNPNALQAAIAERRRMAQQCMSMWGTLGVTYRLNQEQVEILDGMSARLVSMLRERDVAA